jgi:hypothetical protein
MNPDDLYKESQGRMIGMSHRSLVLAIRYGLADWKNGINVQRMLAVIESGEVWRLRGVGKKTVHEWCKFIAEIAPYALPDSIDAKNEDLGFKDGLSPARVRALQLQLAAARRAQPYR